MILQPTMRLRWIDREISFQYGTVGTERVLQQWWQEVNGESGEWRDIEFVEEINKL